jgi:hypothetical protein
VSATVHPAATSAPSGSASPHADLLEQLKAQLPESLYAAVSGTLATYEKKLDTASNELQYSRLKIQLLEDKLRQQRIAKYGLGSETLSNLQLELLEFEPGVSNVEVATESERLALPATSQDKKRRKHPGRQTLPDDLPRVEKIIACAPEQCKCGHCGKDTTVIGYEVSEVLDVKPAEYFVEGTKREKRAASSAKSKAYSPRPLRSASLKRAWCRTLSSSTPSLPNTPITILSIARASFCCATLTSTSAAPRCADG